jgi:cyclopropane-fatty-acyl-phospholipid synthase
VEAHKSEAIAIQSVEVYERYMKYLTGCAKMFRVGYIDVNGERVIAPELTNSGGD